MPAPIEWIVIEDYSNQEIGAIGFIGSRAAVVAAFYDYRDANKDGRVSWGEAIVSVISPISLKNRVVTEVAMAARLDMRVLERDASFPHMAAQLFVNFAAGLIADGVYAVYFSRGVSAVARPIAGRVASGMVKQFVVRKGMEKAVKAVYDGVVKH